MGYDWIIAGGGSAGTVLATRLSEDPAISVLLLEAGDTGPLDSDADLLSNINFALTARDWGMRALAVGDREVDYPQGKFLGGGSSVNGGLAFRGSPDDYDQWSAAGPSWSWASMLPAFKRLETDLDFGSDSTFHGSDGPIPVARWSADDLLPVQEAFGQACMDDGLAWTADHNHPTSTGIGPLPMNRVAGRRMSTAMTYLQPALGRPNLTVVGSAQVSRVQITGGRAVGVEYQFEGSARVAEGDHIVISAGTTRSPGILWRSGVGPSQQLRDLGIDCLVANDAVGANLIEHPGLFLFLKPGRHGPDLSGPQFQLGARYDSSSTGTPNDMLLSMMNFWDLSESPDFAAQVGVPTVVVLTCGVHQPLSRGDVSLVSADPTVAPRINLNLLSEAADLDRLVAALQRCRELAGSAAMKDFVGDTVLLSAADFDDTDALRHYARGLAAPWYHPVGTCRMGQADDGNSVVDDGLRVHGVAGLHVVDASVMPGIPRSPTNLTTIAIAERAVELLLAAS